MEMFNEKKNKNKKSKTIVFFTIGPIFNKHGKDNFMIIFVQAYPVLKFLEAQNMIEYLNHNRVFDRYILFI